MPFLITRVEWEMNDPVVISQWGNLSNKAVYKGFEKYANCYSEDNDRLYDAYALEFGYTGNYYIGTDLQDFYLK
ncbi:MAG: hypothetical protein K9W44_09860 [Candidatus Lokiarchaeota archaeon]|nr:hypothetical protein [Candidatus Harpocratesius repetitus]